jgi:nucleoid DNA-binding protein
MNKAELRAVVQRNLDVSASMAERAVNAVLEGLVEGLHRDSAVHLMGFGTFQVKQRASRVVRNPSTREPMEVPAHLTVQFRPGKALKESL